MDQDNFNKEQAMSQFPDEFELLPMEKYHKELLQIKELDINSNLLGCLLLKEFLKSDLYRQGVMDSLGFKAISDEYARLMVICHQISSNIFENGILQLDEDANAFHEILNIMANDPEDKRNEVLKNQHISEMRIINYTMKYTKQYMHIIKLIEQLLIEKFPNYEKPITESENNTTKALQQFFFEFTNIESTEIGFKIPIPFDDDYFQEMIEQAENVPITSYQGFTLLNGLANQKVNYLSGALCSLGLFDVGISCQRVQKQLNHYQDQMDEDALKVFCKAVRKIDADTAMSFKTIVDDAGDFQATTKAMLQINLIISVLSNRALDEYPFLKALNKKHDESENKNEECVAKGETIQ